MRRPWQRPADSAMKVETFILPSLQHCSDCSSVTIRTRKSALTIRPSQRSPSHFQHHAHLGLAAPGRMTMAISPELLPDGAKGLVFDCDGTLMDTMSQHWTSWRLACAKFGVKMTVQQFIGCVTICCIEQNRRIQRSCVV